MTNDKQQLTDHILLQQYREHSDGESLGILLKRYSLLVFGVCMKYLKNAADAQDASQQVFEKVIQEAHKYEIPYFKSWIYSVARNHCLMHIRTASSKPRVSDEFPEDLSDNQDIEQNTREKAMSKEADEASLLQAIDHLNEDQAKCIRLFYLKKLSYQQIQDLTGLSFQMVKSHIQNGKRNLRIMLEKNKEK